MATGSARSFSLLLLSLALALTVCSASPPQSDIDAVNAVLRLYDKPGTPPALWTGDPCPSGYLYSVAVGYYDVLVRCNTSRVVELQLRGLAAPIPPQIGALSNLSVVSVSCDDSPAAGPLPPEFGNLTQLTALWLSSCGLTGEIPPELGQMAQLGALHLSNNSLEGRIPPQLGRLRLLSSLDLSHNRLEGLIPWQLGRLRLLSSLDLSHNRLTGPIFPQLGTFRRMRFMDLSSNALNGSIPPEFSNMGLSAIMNGGGYRGYFSTDNVLNLSRNNLTGVVPLLTGEGWQPLRVLDLSFNALTGMETSDERYGNLGYLDLSFNRMDNGVLLKMVNFSGLRQAFPSLNILNVSNNDLTGPIPRELGYIWTLWELNLSSSGLTGPIPEEFGKLRSLTSLDLGLNHLRGPLPSGIGNLSRLGFLDLSHNNLTGTIWALEGLLSLSDVDLSFNFFEGRPGRHITSVSRLGSNCFSLIPMQRTTRDCFLNFPDFGGFEEEKKKQGWKLTVGVATASVASFLLIGVIVFLAVWQWRRWHRPPTSVTIQDTLVKKWTLSELRSATNNFDESCRLGKGGAATVYKAVVAGGVLMAVKRLNGRIQEQDREDLMKEVQIVGNIHNRNLLALRGYCIEGGEYLLVYDLMAKGSLEDCLFGKKGVGPLTWPQCVHVLTGTAKAIAYLHEGCTEKIIHRDIKAANILLDSDYTPYVSDFGLIRSTLVAATHVSTRVAGTVGYLAPEYAQTGKLSEKSDVYSFGVLMLVVIGHRPPFDALALESDGFINIVDKVFKFAENDSLADFVAPHFQNDACVQEEALRVLSIALVCIQKVWQARPSMGRVVQMLNGTMDVPTVDLEALTSLSSRTQWSSSASEESRDNINLISL